MKSTQKILVVGLILMGVLNICTLGFIIFKSQQHKHFLGEDRDVEERHGPGGPSKFLSKKLHLTIEQEEILEKLRKPHEENMSKLRALKDSLRKQAFKLVKNDPYDSIKANVVANETGNCHKEMEKEMVAHFLAIKALCTKEQQVDFNNFIEHISSERIHGHGGQDGDRGHGSDSNRHHYKGHHSRNYHHKDCQGS